MWINDQLPESRTNRDRFMFVGWVLAQSLCNRCSLQAPLPEVDLSRLYAHVLQVLFAKLLQGAGFVPSFEALQAFDPAAAAGLQKAARVCIPAAHEHR